MNGLKMNGWSGLFFACALVGGFVSASDPTNICSDRLDCGSCEPEEAFCFCSADDAVKRPPCLSFAKMEPNSLEKPIPLEPIKL